MVIAYHDKEKLSVSLAMRFRAPLHHAQDVVCGKNGINATSLRALSELLEKNDNFLQD
jgi:hypothetical protein